MSKIGLIVEREFNQRVRKRSFILTTVLTPLLMVGLVLAPVLVQKLRDGKQKEIWVSDASGLVAGQLEDNQLLVFHDCSGAAPEELARMSLNGYGYLIIGADILTQPSDVQLFAHGSITVEVERNITTQIRRILEAEKLQSYEIDDLDRILAAVRTDVQVKTYQVSESGEGKRSSGALSMVMAYIFGLLIYMFVFMYGVMVMQGVIEEKSSKVLEIIVSSVRPFQLMMGKILGIGLVALTQFLIWIVLLVILAGTLLPLLPGDPSALPVDGIIPAGVPDMDKHVLDGLYGILRPDYLLRLAGGFMAYFIGGYLLYAAMFAAVGSAVDNVQDSQQLQLPVTIPLILALILAFAVMQQPESPLAFWFGMVPFTSPIIMMARLPYGVPLWEILLSLAILYATFVLMVAMAGKIYRTGIFMYGKKPGISEIFKWINYKS